MDEQNRVEDIDRVDGRSTSEQKKAMMAENSQAQNGQGVQSVQAPYSQVAQPAQSLYQHMPQYGQPVQHPYQPQSQYGQPAQQPYQPQSQYIQGAQPMQTPYQQMPQYGQPTQTAIPATVAVWPANPAAIPATVAVRPAGTANAIQQPYGYMGYENRQNIPDDVKKGSTHVPNMLNLIGIIMAVVSVFIPYAYMGTDARSIVGVFGINVLSMLVVAVVIIADVICAFINKAGCYIADLVISIVVGGILIFEFVLSLIDLGKLDAAANARLGVGAWISVAAALFMLISVPIWWTISRKKDKAEKQD
ncbi:hypothetical protein [Coprococcus sp. OM06-25]|uniref:hypothetical protein n=1 Tax=Coprococcus sp. OM06-25 TaxID=2293094 RepID=UPI0011C0FEB5|nr:hypothetical protein [Coprococcus sp. OM06-25]